MYLKGISFLLWFFYMCVCVCHYRHVCGLVGLKICGLICLGGVTHTDTSHLIPHDSPNLIFSNKVFQRTAVCLHGYSQPLMVFVQLTGHKKTAAHLRKKKLDRVSVSSTLSPSESSAELQLWNQNVSHIALALALLPQQLTNCGENI